jgi:hypothetical protein
MCLEHKQDASAARMKKYLKIEDFGFLVSIAKQTICASKV